MTNVSGPRRLAALALLVVSGLAVAPAAAQSPSGAQQPLPLGPARERGTSITPAFEGWYQNEDGTYSLLVGYFNRNKGEALDIPVGPNNKIEPGPIDQGQPTHFATGREWGVFVIRVPKDFGKKTLTWTVTANGETQSVPLGITNGYTIEPFQERGMGNKPPEFTFGGTKVFGPPSSVAATLTGTVNQPVAISFAVNDPKETKKGSARAIGRGGAGSVATVSFHKHRGPGDVKVDPARISTKTQDETVTTNATFSLPGEYLVRVQGNDESGEGGGGFQCCWTNTYVKVTVK
ncbi:MAG: hypothetical protein R2708_22390 [Vicinamibacterales bacterium]